MPTFLNLSSANAAFTAYAITVVILCFNMLLLWAMSGGVRGKAKSTPNPEDTKSVVPGAQVSLVEPESVARVLRAHRNAEANIIPFLFLGLIYVMLGGPAMVAQIIFGIFVVARVGHSVAYLGARQPYRTLSFAIGALATLGLIVDIIRLLVR